MAFSRDLFLFSYPPPPSHSKKPKESEIFFLSGIHAIRQYVHDGFGTRTNKASIKSVTRHE